VVVGDRQPLTAVSRKRISRRSLLRLGAAASVAFALSGRRALDVAASTLAGMPGSGWLAGTTASAVPRTLYRAAAIADGRSPALARQMSVLVSGGRVAWIRPADAEEDPGPADGLEIVDARGLTILPGLVDGHCHLTSPGGPDYIAHFEDAPSQLLRTAERNGQLSHAAGVAWLREAGSPTVTDPTDGRRRALALGIRDRWAGRTDRPRVRAAGTWIQVKGGLARNLGIVVSSGDELVAAVERQLDQGADLVKLYVAADNSRQSPWTPAQINRAVQAAHARGARVAAHAMWLGQARAAVAGGVDSIEHGFHLDADLCAEMVRRGTYLVTTLSVPRSWLRIGSTTSGTWWSTRAGRRFARNMLSAGAASVDAARRAGVMICAGSDFGGGSTPAGQLAWEVESLVSAGLEPWQAVGAATWRGGDLLREPTAGRLREDGPADFFLVEGDPYSDPAALWNVRRLA
jgi:imidazolonepropionase-like amidohydrolase